MSSGLDEPDKYVIDPSFEKYMSAFSEQFVKETIGLGMSIGMNISDTLTPGQTQQWWGALSQIFIQQTHTQTDNEQLQILFCSTPVSRMMLSLNRVVTALPDNDLVLTNAKAKAPNLPGPVALKVIAVGIAQCTLGF